MELLCFDAKIDAKEAKDRGTVENCIILFTNIFEPEIVFLLIICVKESSALKWGT